jgi:type I restriction enzyme, S subunit
LAVWSIVNFSQIPFDWRLDAEYFQPQYLELDKLLSNSNIELWGSLKGDFITGPFGSAFTVDNYVDQSLYRYIRGKDVKPFFLLENDNAYMPEKEFKNLEKYSLYVDDLLVSVVGTLGNVAIVDKDLGQAIFSCKSTVFRSKSINPYYLCAYLNSSIGQAYFQRKPRGAIQTGLNLDDLHTIPIFIPSPEKQVEIGKLVKNALCED